MTRNWTMMAGLLVLAACGEKGGTDAVKKATNTPGATQTAGTGQPSSGQTRFFSEQSFTHVPATECKGTPGLAVTWTLKEVLSGLSNNRRITRTIMRSTGKVPKLPTSAVGDNWPTTLDMDIASAGSDYVMVNVVLTIGANGNKPGVHFLRPRSGTLPTGPNPGGDNSSVAVLTPAPEPGKVEYCGRTPIDTSDPDTESFSFGVRKAVGARSLNIGLLVPTEKESNETQMWLPIFLDPNVRNEG